MKKSYVNRKQNKRKRKTRKRGGGGNVQSQPSSVQSINVQPTNGTPLNENKKPGILNTVKGWFS